MSLSHPYSATQVVQVVLDQVIKLHGLPKSIITDRDKNFVSQFWKELFNIMGVQTKCSTAYHPQTDGQSEILNHRVEIYLRCMSRVKPTQWSKWLPLAEWWYNTTFHSAIGMSPFKALYGSEAPIVNYHQLPAIKVATVDEFVKNRSVIQGLLKENVLKVAGRMKMYADKGITERDFAVRDEVFLKIQPYKQASIYGN